MSDGLVLRGGTVLSASGWLSQCDVQIAAGRIVALGGAAGAGGEGLDARDHLVVPGFVDVHVHGAGGAMFENGCDDAVARIRAALPRFGVTGVTATIATLPPERLRAAVAAIARAAAEGGGTRLLGIHLEGPFLNPQRCGAQAAAWMRAPSLGEVQALQRASGGLIRLITLAPELPGALELIAALRGQGIAVAIGHSDASEDQMLAAVAAGATHITHLFNAAAPLHHRAPGLVGTALTDDRLSVEVIADGIHLHRRALDIALRCKPPGSVVLVSDGVAAVGMPDGELELFGVTCVAHDAVRIRATGRLAGSRLTLDRAVRNLRDWFPGTPLERWLRAASAAPAAVVGLGDRFGSIAVGYEADLVVLTRNLEVAVTVVHGRIVYRA